MKLDGRTCQQTLAFVNRIRAEQGRAPLDELPKGKPCSPSRCPVGVAIGGRAYRGLIAWGNLEDRKYRRTPDEVDVFMVAFDARRIPELIA